MVSVLIHADEPPQSYSQRRQKVYRTADTRVRLPRRMPTIVLDNPPRRGVMFHLHHTHESLPLYTKAYGGKQH